MTSPLLSTVVMGGVLLIIVAIVLRTREWRQPPATAAWDLTDVVQAANGPLGWAVAFFIIAFGVMGLSMLYVTGTPVAGLDQAELGVVLMIVVTVVFIGGSLVAVYAEGRKRGLHSA